ncbi:hypothetical protein EV1_015349 [Malus domestica]
MGTKRSNTNPSHGSESLQVNPVQSHILILKKIRGTLFLSCHSRVRLHFTLPGLPDLPACPRLCSFALATKYTFPFCRLALSLRLSLSEVDRKPARNRDFLLDLTFN